MRDWYFVLLAVLALVVLGIQLDASYEGNMLFMGVYLILALPITWVTIAWLYAVKRKLKKHAKQQLILSTFCVNVISCALLWLFIGYMLGDVTLSPSLLFSLSEVGFTTLEAYFIHRFNKKIMNMQQSLALSLLMNLANIAIPIGVFLLGTHKINIV